jgi:chemotaxis response regulator CheB/chemotaxis methyl-accepting protein methylase
MSGARKFEIKPPQNNVDKDGHYVSSKFNQHEREIIYARAERITGTSQRGRYRKDVLLNNIEKRMHEIGIQSVTEYLQFAEGDESEQQYLVSALTIHTTSWFRELPHYNTLEKMIRDNIEEFLSRPLMIYCAASSTGEEVYSFGLMCQLIKDSHPQFEYKILGHDIDPISISKAKRAVYPADGVQSIPQKCRKFLLMGSGKTQGFFTIDKEIRKRCDFGVANLREKQNGVVSFDIVVCRNALIYFEPGVMNAIVANLLRLLKPGGVFVVGTSDFVEADKHNLKDLGKSIHVVEGNNAFEGKNTQPRVLIIDDSLTIRNSLSKLLVKEGFRPDAVGSAAEATEFLKREKVSLITLDLHMPGMDGQTWLSAQRSNGLETPVVIISGADPSEAKAVLNALGSGAQDYFEKESLMNNPQRVVEGLRAIAETYNNKRDKKPKAPGAEVFQPKLKIKPKRPSVILIGSSTGGTEALIRFLDKMPMDCPPIVIVQHINLTYAKPFHERLCRVSGLQMAEATNAVVLRPGTIYMTHTDNHIEIQEKGEDVRIKTSHMAAINGVRPAVDCLFRSGTFLGTRACAILLTGMGRDGAQGMLELRKKGAVTLCQDEESCVVFGMPKAAIGLGAAMVVGNLPELRIELKSIIDGKNK